MLALSRDAAQKDGQKQAKREKIVAGLTTNDSINCGWGHLLCCYITWAMPMKWNGMVSEIESSSLSLCAFLSSFLPSLALWMLVFWNTTYLVHACVYLT